ncbi:MAG: hypothetical protein HPM95_01300 [Alphaproteobacteria bacterium]|nr:hypothetical protein [Alphaproteobacteria bacterium]
MRLLALPGFSSGPPITSRSALLLLPLTIGFQISNFLYTASKHRWWAFSNQTIRDREKKDFLSFTRVCCCKAPERNTFVAWIPWWIRAVSIHMPRKWLFVVVGDTVHHDLHHIAP